MQQTTSLCVYVPSRHVDWSGYETVLDRNIRTSSLQITAARLCHFCRSMNNISKSSQRQRNIFFSPADGLQSFYILSNAYVTDGKVLCKVTAERISLLSASLQASWELNWELSCGPLIIFIGNCLSSLWPALLFRKDQEKNLNAKSFSFTLILIFSLFIFCYHNT